MTRDVQNPVLRGFMPDASVVRIGDHFLLANSSFEWMPAIPLHRSDNLVEWEPAGSFPAEFVDLRGVADSCGIWAPSLSTDGDRVWLVFSTVYTNDGGEKDIRTAISRSSDDGATWERPTRVPSTGFDPALFHEGGRVWLLNMKWDAAPERPSFAGITLQELDAATLAPRDVPRVILSTGTLIEGPGLEFRDGWYWLSVAEGGTGWEHGITMFRSRSIDGPYQRDPIGSYLTTREAPEHWAQKAGHGEIVTLDDGERVLVHLGSRVLRRGDDRHGVLGRETFAENVELTDDGWPRLASGTTLPAERFTVPGSLPAPHGRAAEPEGWGDGSTPAWPWSTLRRPADRSWADLDSRPGWLRLRGGDSLHSRFEQSLVARRVRELPTTLAVTLDAAPTDIAHAAALVVWYDTSTYAALLVTIDESGARHVVLRSRDDGERPIDLASAALQPGDVTLRATLDEDGVRFAYAAGAGHITPIGDAIDLARFTDDYRGRLRFTGPMIGVTAIDTVDGAWTADIGDVVFTETPHD
ncbi:family 43 glycosylhydrolase [Agromyces atrinae]|uniref:family 43 glycosylhydrolase n=1 Tax=Agromyces atrinae TaxID=592376 RepID=UPI001F576C77|nr:family 43 glycosylhydrolase [Agromyces atrinae]MCI2957215.1 family 43 glycosylhydrolase [Agromyces atrinae]